MAQEEILFDANSDRYRRSEIIFTELKKKYKKLNEKLAERTMKDAVSEGQESIS